MKRLLRVAGVAMVLAVASVAGAQSSAPTAEQIKAAAAEFDQARQAYKSRDFVEAAEHFEAADRHAPSVSALELAIRSRAKAGQLERAATLAALGLVRNPDNAGIKRLARAILKKADRQLYRVDVHCSSPCDLVVGTKLVYGKASTEKTVYLQPGSYTLRAGWSGRRNTSKKITATKGASGEVFLKEPPKPPPGNATSLHAGAGKPAGPGDHGVEVKPSGWSPVVFWIGTGLTVVAGGMTAWSGIDTQKHPGAEAVRNACYQHAPDCQTLYQDGRGRQTRTNILAGVTAGLGVVTLVVGAFATDWSGGSPAKEVKKTARTTRVEPWVGVDHGATLGVRGRF